MTRERRTQAERSDATVTRLLVATVTALVEVGYRGATTTEITQRAGVSRGAMLHHFPNRAALFAATADWICDGHIRRFEAGLAEVSDGADRVGASIDLLWEICSSPEHVAWLEFTSAAHHEPEIAATVTLAVARTRDRTHRVWTAHFPEVSNDPIADAAPEFTVALLEGLALSQRAAPDHRVVEEVLDSLKRVALLLFLPSTSRAVVGQLMSEARASFETP